MYFFYNFLVYLALPFIPLRLFFRGLKNPDYNEYWKERFAFKSALPKMESSFWVHVASLGEAVSAIPLVRGLMTKYPNEKIVVTTMTPTGREKLKSVFGDTIFVSYVPYDFPFAVKKFIKSINPKLLMILETEIWPNLLLYVAKKKVPIILANARIADRSYRSYARIKPFMKRVLNFISLVAAQSVDDGIKFLQLGLEAKRLSVMGNIKFDISIPGDISEYVEKMRRVWRLDYKRPVWIAASTHHGEEEKILAAAKIILEKVPKALLILVPRHPERFDEVFHLCKEQGFNVLRYSKEFIVSASTEIILGDVMGKLLYLYALARVAFVGGSLVPVGGHNLLEPAAVMVPVLTGPFLDNFSEIKNILFTANAALLVRNEKELADGIVRLFLDSDLNEKMSRDASQVVAQNRGALGQILKWVESAIS